MKPMDKIRERLHDAIRANEAGLKSATGLYIGEALRLLESSTPGPKTPTGEKYSWWK